MAEMDREQLLVALKQARRRAREAEAKLMDAQRALGGVAYADWDRSCVLDAIERTKGLIPTNTGH